MSTEHYAPVIQRTFNILLRHGILGEVPKKLQIDDGSGMAFIPPPNVTFIGRIALALKQIHLSAFNDSIARRTGLGAILGPAAFDDLNLPVALADMDRATGLPQAWTRTSEEVAKIQQAREQQQQLAADAAAAKDIATAAGKAKGTALENAVA
jgi:hypothetical protein